MNTEEILTLAGQVLQPWEGTTLVSRPHPNQLDVQVHVPGELIPMVVGLRVKRLGYLSAIVGLDLGPGANQLEVLYYFCTDGAVIVLRLRVPRENGSLPSLGEIVPSAEVFERELCEMFGIEIKGLASSEHLYLPDDWPQGIYPLRKDFDPAVLTAKSGEA